MFIEPKRTNEVDDGGKMKGHWSHRIAAVCFVLGTVSLVMLQSPLPCLMSENWRWGLGAFSAIAFVLSGVELFLTMGRWNSQVASATSKVSDHASMVAEVRGMLRADAAILSTIRSVSLDTIHEGSEGHQEYVRTMTGRALVHFLARDYSKYIDRLDAIIKDPHEKMELDDERLIGLSVEELERVLPNNSVWCGVSLVAAEEYESDTLKAFYSRSRAKVKNGELSMRILYVVGEKALWVSKEKAELDATSGVDVKTTGKTLKDMSLVWVPRSTARKAKLENQGADLFEVIEEYYDPAVYLEFGLSMGILRSMTVHPGSADAFGVAFEKFKEDWKSGQELSGGGGASGGSGAAVAR